MIVIRNWFPNTNGTYKIYPIAGYSTTGTGNYVQYDFGSDSEFLSYIDRFRVCLNI